MRAHGLSLWLLPEPSARRWLAATIDRLARRLGTPRFAPHVTLVGRLSASEREVLAAAARLAGTTGPFQLRPTRVGQRAEPLRCVFVALAPSAALRRLRARARTALGPSRRRFFAHLSLVYGDLPARTRRALAAELSRATPTPFRVARLQLVRTQGEPREWRPLAEFALRSRSRTWRRSASPRRRARSRRGKHC